MRAEKNCLVYIPVSFALASCLFACSVDDGDDGQGNVQRIPSNDPAFDQELDDKDIICQSSLTVSGTFTLGEARPLGEGGISGCWGVGTWKVTPQVDRVGCNPQAQAPAELEYKAEYLDNDEVENSTIVTLVTGPESSRVNFGITATGDGCEGKFEHFGSDYSVWQFDIDLGVTPDDMAVGETTPLSGTGTYSVFEYDPS